MLYTWTDTIVYINYISIKILNIYVLKAKPTWAYNK